MVEKIFFNSSMPRSGSTLLQNLLAQNPDIYSTPTSGLIELIYGARGNFSDQPEFISQDKDEMAKAFNAFCRDGVHGFANALTDRKYFIDKGRSWLYYSDWVENFLPYRPKVLSVVRDLRDVFSSQEKLFRKDKIKDNKIVNWMELRNTTIEKRCDFYASAPPIGIYMDKLLDTIRIPEKTKNAFFIKYEDLCLNPEHEIRKIYNFLEIPFFNHNFDFIPQVTFENDDIHIAMADHKIRQKLELKHSDAYEILGKPACDWITHRYKWFYEFFKYPI
jgi:sulfotransferase